MLHIFVTNIVHRYEEDSDEKKMWKMQSEKKILPRIIKENKYQ